MDGSTTFESESMTVGELIEKLSVLEPDRRVCVADCKKGTMYWETRSIRLSSSDPDVVIDADSEGRTII